MMVDERSLGGIRVQVALAPATLLSGTGLVINQYRAARNIAQLSLHLVQLRAVVEAYVIREQFLMAIVLFGLITEHHNPTHTFSRNLLRYHRHRNLAIHGLTAGHGHCVIEQNLVSNVDAGRNGLANRHGPGMEIGALPQILEHVGITGVTALANPVDPFTAHLDQRLGVTTHPGRHKVTTDPGQRFTAFRHFGGGIVRAARTEIRQALYATRILSIAHTVDGHQAFVVVLTEKATKASGQKTGY